MRLLSFRYDGEVGFGAVSGEGVVDLGRRLGGGIDSVRALLERGALARAEGTRPENVPRLCAGRDRVSAASASAGKSCVGINYARRNDEYRDGRRPLERPNLFLRTAHSFVRTRAPSSARTSPTSSTTRARSRS